MHDLAAERILGNFAPDYGEGEVRALGGGSNGPVPGSTAAEIVAETTLGSVDKGDGFTEREGVFLTEAAMAGKTPRLTIRAGVRLGTLQIRAT